MIPPYINSLTKRWHTFLFNEANWSKHLDEGFELLGLALQSNISNCLVLILHTQLGNYLLITGESYCQTAKHIHRTLCKSMFDTYQVNYSLRLRTAHCTESQYPSVAMIYRWVPLKPDFLGAWKSVRLKHYPAYPIIIISLIIQRNLATKIRAKRESGLTAVWLKRDPPVCWKIVSRWSRTLDQAPG